MPQINNPLFKGAFKSAADETNGMGKRPVIFDIIAPDGETSILPDDVKLVLHVNPQTMKPSYQKVIQRIQTKGGYVEQHWGEGTNSISFEAATGGFMRLYTGLTNITGGGVEAGGTRRDTIAYDKYLDFLALFHNNGSIYDSYGQIAYQGQIKIIFDGHIHYGWFGSFSVSEASDKPYQFNLSASFTIHHEEWRFRTARVRNDDLFGARPDQQPTEAKQLGG
jgi:hypothetical protein